MHKKTNTLLNQKDKKKRAEGEDYKPDDILDFEQLEQIIKTSSRHCSEKNSTKFSCILSNFLSESGFPSVDKAIALLSDCREITRCKNAIEKDKFLYEEFRNSIVNFHEVLKDNLEEDEEKCLEDSLLEAEQDVLHCLPCYIENNKSSIIGKRISDKEDSTKGSKKKRGRFFHEFLVISKVNNYKPIKVCRRCWSHLFGFSKWKLEQASFKIKDTNNIRPNPTNIDIYDDKTYHDFSHDENMAIFKELGVGQKQCKNYYKSYQL